MLQSKLRAVSFFFTITACIILTLPNAVVSNAETISARDVRRSLSDDLTHPYLYFTQDDKQDILLRIENDPEFGEVWKKTLAEANRLMHTPVSYDIPDAPLNPRYEADYSRERFLYDYSGAAYTLAIVYQLTGDESYAEKAYQFADVVCNAPSWVHSVHRFPVIYDRVWPWNADNEDDYVVFSYAQASDHIVFDIAAAYDWLYPALSRRQRDRIRGALLENCILTVRGNYRYHWWATAYKCNWCSVCHSSIGVAALALIKDNPELTDVIAASYNHISLNLDEIKSGGWAEGMGYLRYTLRTSAHFADVFNRASEGTYNLYEHPRYEEGVLTLLYGTFPPNESIHFGDSGATPPISYSLMNRFMLERNDAHAAFLREMYTDEKPAQIADILIPKSTLAPQTPPSPSKYFDTVGWVVMRSDFTDPDKFVIAGKSAPHDDPHHGHLDSGHFSLWWRGCEFIADNGSAGYDRDYFDNARYERYPLAMSAGHNTVLVNGEQQIPGKRKNETLREDIGGTVISFDSSNTLDYAALRQDNAYPGVELQDWVRHIILEKPTTAVVVDEVEHSSNADIEIRWHSEASMALVDSEYTLLHNNDDTVAVIPVFVGTHDGTMVQDAHALMMAQRDAKFRWKNYVDAEIHTDSGRTVCVTVIAPVNSKEDAEALKNSIMISGDGESRLVISFSVDGGIYEYQFGGDSEGRLELTR